MKKLDVLFRGWGQSWTLGTLADVAGKVYFEYSDEALKRGIEHSPHKLKLAAGTHSGFPGYLNGLPGFINDALPDGWGLLLMDRMWRHMGHDPATLSPLDRLSFIGERAIGALAFKPGVQFSPTEADLDLLSLANASRGFSEDREVSALKTLAIVGGSPHGARPKALVQYDATSQLISTREDAPGAPWLVKFQAAAEHKDVCAIEQVYADMARACGIEMPTSKHFSLGKSLAAFGVARFDRERGLRVPVQSFAGALHADFRQPSIDYVTVLRIVRFFTRDEREVLKAYQRCIFNVVFNNQDDHAKNFAFRMGEDMAWRISPAYDLTFAHGPGGQHQTSISGAGVPAYADLLRLADEGGVRRQEAQAVIDHACQQTAALSGALQNAGVRTQAALEIANKVADNAKRCSGPPATAAAAARGVAKSSTGKATTSAKPRKRVN